MAPIKPEFEKEVLVIGVGNSFRGDDGVGLFLAHRLKGRKIPNTIIERHSGEGTSLMDLWKTFHRVILLDALHSGAPPGKIYRFDVHMQSLPSHFFNHSTHSFGVAEAISLARALNRLPRYFAIYGIEGKQFMNGGGLSSEVKKAAGEVLERVIGEINGLQSQCIPFDHPASALP